MARIMARPGRRGVKSMLQSVIRKSVTPERRWYMANSLIIQIISLLRSEWHVASANLLI